MSKILPAALKSFALVLPALFLSCAQAIGCDSGMHHASGPNYPQAISVIVCSASVILGLPFLAFGFIHLLAGDTKPGVIRLCTFIGAITVCIGSALLIERL